MTPEEAEAILRARQQGPPTGMPVAPGMGPPPLPASDPWGELLARANRSAQGARTDLRNTLAFAIDNPGQGGPGDPGAHSLHQAWMSNSAQHLTPRLGEDATRALLWLLGQSNEMLSGGVEAATGGSFFSPRGYDREDILANSAGIDRGVQRSRDNPEDPTPPGAEILIRRRRGR